jgi:hypothetical protein
MTMRHVLIAAAALAAAGFAAATPASAQSAMPYVAGGPERVGNMCIVKTDSIGNDDYGYYAPCGQQAQARAPRRSKKR